MTMIFLYRGSTHFIYIYAYMRACTHRATRLRSCSYLASADQGRWLSDPATSARLIRFRCARVNAEGGREREVGIVPNPSCEKSMDGGSDPAPARESPRSKPAARFPARTAADASRAGGSPEGPPSRCAIRRGGGEKRWIRIQIQARL